MIRLGLCCIFVNEPIKFRTITAKRLSQFSKKEQLKLLSEICLHNSKMLIKSLLFCKDHHIGSFRIQSGIFPLRTHPLTGYDIQDLPEAEAILKNCKLCEDYCSVNNIRTTLHPDQFIVLSSPFIDVVKNSLTELYHQNETAKLFGADVINIHCGGVYKNKKMSLRRLFKEMSSLPLSLKKRITLENDDKSYTPDDVIPLCKELSIPFVYDIHHHRCLQKDISVKKTTASAISTWDREPLFHLSSPKDGWHKKNPRFHSDFINYQDFPEAWKKLDITVEIEAKAKELSVKKLYQQLLEEGIQILNNKNNISGD